MRDKSRICHDMMDSFDTRPAIAGRFVSSRFRPVKRWFGLSWHLRPSNVGTTILLVRMFAELFLNLRALLKLRRARIRGAWVHGEAPLRVLFYSDNLDEVNGIANSLRLTVPHLNQKPGVRAYLAGSAFNTRPCGVVENSFVFLFPRVISMEQLGYADSELASPYLAPLLRFFKRYPVDIVELETPSPGAWMVGIAAKIVGIPVVSHYRTDVPSYTRTLVKQRWMQNYVLWLMRVFYQHATPVVSPCEAYRKKLVEEIHVRPQDIAVLPRGIELNSFDPALRSARAEGAPVRFLYVGRISKEKDIPFLEEVWARFCQRHGDTELCFVGGGWYLDTLREHTRENPTVRCLGVKAGRELAALYADADFFVFPSGSDTFGNVVVESFASGTPALVSDEGGPQDIVGSGRGWVVPFHDAEAWLAALERAYDFFRNHGEEYQAMRESCLLRSKAFTLDAMTDAQVEFFKKIIGS
jgi:glycosyltransferase involved in cell wall biosynthesis